MTVWAECVQPVVVPLSAPNVDEAGPAAPSATAFWSWKLPVPLPPR